MGLICHKIKSKFTEALLDNGLLREKCVKNKFFMGQSCTFNQCSYVIKMNGFSSLKNFTHQ